MRGEVASIHRGEMKLMPTRTIHTAFIFVVSEVLEATATVMVCLEAYSTMMLVSAIICWVLAQVVQVCIGGRLITSIAHHSFALIPQVLEVRCEQYYDDTQQNVAKKILACVGVAFDSMPVAFAQR